jgi:hypothetical protein
MQEKPTDQKQILLADIGNKWSKFTKQELHDLRNNYELAIQVAAKYGLEEDAAQHEVAVLLKGRSFQ